MKEQSINKKIGEEIRMIRLKKNLSQEVLADELEISVSTWSNLERGITGFTVSRLSQILTLLETDLIEFFKKVMPSESSSIDDPMALYTKSSSSKIEELEKEIRSIKLDLERMKKI